MTITIPPGEFDAFIFDCDGTLIDSMALHLDAWRAALELHGFPRDQFTDKMHYDFAGMPGPAIVKMLNGQFGTNLSPAEVEAAKLEWYLAHHDEIKPVTAVVEIARARFGKIPMAVASGSDAEIVRQGLNAVGILEWFPTIITPADVAEGKPAPDMFLLAAKRLGVEPRRCLVFEDGQLGIQAADAAGMAHVFVPTPALAEC